MRQTYERLPPGGRDALRKYAGGIFLAKAGSKLCLRPGPKATEGEHVTIKSAQIASHAGGLPRAILAPDAGVGKAET